MECSVVRHSAQMHGLKLPFPFWSGALWGSRCKNPIVRPKHQTLLFSMSNSEQNLQTTKYTKHKKSFRGVVHQLSRNGSDGVGGERWGYRISPRPKYQTLITHQYVANDEWKQNNILKGNVKASNILLVTLHGLLLLIGYCEASPGGSWQWNRKYLTCQIFMIQDRIGAYLIGSSKIIVVWTPHHLGATNCGLLPSQSFHCARPVVAESKFGTEISLILSCAARNNRALESSLMWLGHPGTVRSVYSCSLYKSTKSATCCCTVYLHLSALSPLVTTLINDPATHCWS